MVALENRHRGGNLYSEEGSKTSVIPLDIEFLKQIVNEYEAEYLPKIWKRIVSRILDLKSFELKDNNIFKGLTQEAVMFFCNLCEIKIYN